jgi:hypothetical protein
MPPMRCLLQATTSGVNSAVLTLSSEEPGVAATWAFPNGSAFTFSVRPHRGGAVMAAAMKRAGGQPATTRGQRKRMEHVLGVWLARASMTLEGHSPWPTDMPADVRRTCAPRPLVGATDSVSASVLIAAPLEVVWEAVWSPNLSSDDVLACGHVPGTPLQEPGEMQYFISPRPGGHLLLRAVIVREIDPQHSATAQSLGSLHQEDSYLLTAETGGIRFGMTTSWALASIRGEPELIRERMAESVRSATDHCKATVERSLT